MLSPNFSTWYKKYRTQKSLQILRPEGSCDFRDPYGSSTYLHNVL